MKLFQRKKKETIQKEIAEIKEITKRNLSSRSDSLASLSRERSGESRRAKGEIASKILLKPILTEKSEAQKSLNKYVFEVNPKANKIEIKKAIFGLYGFQPLSIRIQKIPGKKVRYGKSFGKTKNYKKAIVTLKAGEKIEFA